MLRIPQIDSIFDLGYNCTRILCIWITLLLFITSCASPIELRPKAIIEAEQYLQSGTAAYNNDEFAIAANNFNLALQLYQSVDNPEGALLTFINLVETAIAIGNFSLANEHMDNIQTLLTHNPDLPYQTRSVLLQVKLDYYQGNDEAALASLKPLLPAFDEKNQITERDSYTLNILANMARLAVRNDELNSAFWLQQFETEIVRAKDANATYAGLLNRLKAQHKLKEGDYDNSRLYINQALRIYQQLAYRRGIANSLQQLAELELRLQNLLAADQLLQRALKIHLWTLNKKASIQVLQALVEINRDLGNKQATRDFSAQLEKLQP